MGTEIRKKGFRTLKWFGIHEDKVKEVAEKYAAVMGPPTKLDDPPITFNAEVPGAMLCWPGGNPEEQEDLKVLLTGLQKILLEDKFLK